MANLSFPRVLEWNAKLGLCISPLPLNVRSKVGGQTSEGQGDRNVYKETTTLPLWFSNNTSSQAPSVLAFYPMEQRALGENTISFTQPRPSEALLEIGSGSITPLLEGPMTVTSVLGI